MHTLDRTRMYHDCPSIHCFTDVKIEKALRKMAKPKANTTLTEEALLASSPQTLLFPEATAGMLLWEI